MRDIMLEGDYAFRVMENGEAEFCWFRSQYEGTGADIPEAVEIPDRVREHPVTGIQPLGFVEFEAIRRISLPDTVVFSESTPFESCPNLEEIVVSPGHPSLTVENGLLIDRAAKRVLCCPAGSRMETVQVPEWVTSVGNNAFANCTHIRSVVLPEGILEIGQGAFFGCVRLGRISVPSGVREIGNYTFMDCAGLKEISLPEGIWRIGDFAFAFCTSLTSLRLPDSVESFGCFSFSDCENLREVNLPLQLKETSFLHAERSIFVIWFRYALRLSSFLFWLTSSSVSWLS